MKIILMRYTAAPVRRTWKKQATERVRSIAPVLPPSIAAPILRDDPTVALPGGCGKRSCPGHCGA
jgi:hypothetical protein